MLQVRDTLFEEADSSARQLPQQSDRGDSSTEGGSSPTTPRRAPKGPLEGTLQPQKKRQKWDAIETLDTSETESGDIFDFDPTELVKNREGSFVISKSLEIYLSTKAMSDQRRVRGSVQGAPKTEVCTVPKTDRYIAEYLG